jgi:hypothetical protein
MYTTEMPDANKGSPKILGHLPTHKRTVLSPGKRGDKFEELDSPPSEQDKSDEMLNLKGPEPKTETKNVQQESERVQNVVLDSTNDTEPNILDNTTNTNITVCENSNKKAPTTLHL